MRILIVEDDYGSRRLMQTILSSYGECDIVVNGEEAVEAFKLAWEENRPYKLIIMDIMMPKMNGHQSLEKIRSIEKEYGISSTDGVKAIMTTVMDDPKNVIRAFNQGGANAYLTKPVDTEKLKIELEKIEIYPL